MNVIHYEAVQFSRVVGLVPVGYNISDFTPAYESFIVAHDVVEHPYGYVGMGTVGNELMAIGASAITRGHSRTILASLCQSVLYSPYSVISYGNEVPYGVDEVNGEMDGIFKGAVEYLKSCPCSRFLTVDINDSYYFMKAGYLALMGKFDGHVKAAQYFNSVQCAVSEILHPDGNEYRNALKVGQRIELCYDFKSVSFNEV